MDSGKLPIAKVKKSDFFLCLGFLSFLSTTFSRKNGKTNSPTAMIFGLNGRPHFWPNFCQKIGRFLDP